MLHGKSADALRINPRDGWYHNLKEVVTNGELRADLSTHSALALVASGYSAA
jgi:hypothetical protein